MKYKVFRGSTALAVVLALSVSPNTIAFAQQQNAPEVDCEADPANEACVAVPAEEAPAEEAPATEAPAEEAPAAETEAGVEAESAPAEEAPATEAPAEEAPAAEAEAEVEAETAPAEEAPATEAPAEEAPASEAEAEVEAETAPAEEAPAAEQPAQQQPAEQQPAGETQAPQDPAVTDADGGAVQSQPEASATGSAETEAPATVVPDEITAEQRAQIQAEEQQRRDEARKRRNELLGAAAVGAGIGMLIPALGGKVVEDQGDRIIVERDGEYFVRKDESSLLRDGDVEVRVERLSGGRTQETITRRNGVQIITVRDEGGYVLYRSRVMPDGREYVLIDNHDRDDRIVEDYDRILPPLRVDIPRERYIVVAREADSEIIYETFSAPPVEEVENAYTLREVRESERLRDKVRRVDLDTITFDTDSATVRESQVPLLEGIARAALALIEQDPETVLLVEGHTDAVGSDVYNLALSDRRAETVARILADRYDVPPENMVIQGYGEQFLKVDTESAEQQNRRVTMRNITPLLSAQQQ